MNVRDHHDWKCVATAYKDEGIKTEITQYGSLDHAMRAIKAHVRKTYLRVGRKYIITVRRKGDDFIHSRTIIH